MDNREHAWASFMEAVRRNRLTWAVVLVAMGISTGVLLSRFADRAGPAGDRDASDLPTESSADLLEPEELPVAFGDNDNKPGYADPLAEVPAITPRDIPALVLNAPPENVTFDLEAISPALEADIRSMVGITATWLTGELDVEVSSFTVVGRSSVRQLVDHQVDRQPGFPRLLLESEWEVAAGMAMDGVIYLKLDGEYLEYDHGWMRSTLLNVIAHEMGHIAASQLSRGMGTDAPRWLKEGLAELQAAIVADAAGFEDFDWYRDIATVAGRRIATDLDGLESSGPFSGGSTDHYVLGFLATDYLTADRELQSISEFWRLIGDGMAWEQAFMSAFDIDLAAFIRDFELYRTANFPAYPGRISGKVLTPSGRPDAGVHVWACGVTSYDCFHTTTDTRGSFSIAVASDRYTIQLSDTVDEYGVDYPPLEALFFSSAGNTLDEGEATVLRVFDSPVTGVEIRR